MAQFISVIIPAFNSQDYIRSCLDAVFSQDYPADSFEVIVVDNGSVDQTLELVKRHRAKIVSTSSISISRSRNLGAQEARGEIFVFLDSDCEVPKNWLRTAEDLFSREEVSAAGCWYELPEQASFWARTWEVCMRHRRHFTGKTMWVPSCGLFVRKTVFEEIGGFSEGMSTSEDVDLCRRIRDTGRLIFSKAELAVRHLRNPRTLADFFRKEKWRGEGVILDFLCRLPKIKLNKALAFVFVNLLLLVCCFTGLMIWLSGGSPLLCLVSSGIFFMIPLMLSFRTVAFSQDWPQIFPLAILFFTYGMARTCSLCSPRAWSLRRTQS